MIRKNKKFIDPRYFMDEKLERPLNEGIGPQEHATLIAAMPLALEQQLKNSTASRTTGMEVDVLFNSSAGVVWKMLKSAGWKVSGDDIRQGGSPFYKLGNKIDLPSGGYVQVFEDANIAAGKLLKWFP